MRDALQRRAMFAAYACSGFGGLVYQVTWARLLTLHVGHTTAAVVAVVAAFMGGLGAGAFVGSRVAGRWSPAQSLALYAVLEVLVAAYALTLPLAIDGFTPLLRSAYANGGGPWFNVARTAVCLGLVGIPATLLGATFPITLRAFGADLQQTVVGSRLYAANTAGAAAGAMSAGFVLLPSAGVFRTTLCGAAASILAAAIAWRVRRSGGLGPVGAPARRGKWGSTRLGVPVGVPASGQFRAAAIILGMTGLAGLLYEVAWTRAVASLLGPTTYAFAGTVSVLISGLAAGGAVGGVLVTRRIPPHTALATSLSLTAAVVWWANGVLGNEIPSYLANMFAAAGSSFSHALARGAAIVFSLLLPAAFGLGLSLPLALSLVGPVVTAPGQISALYALNTASGVLGTLSFGWLLSSVGLEGSLRGVPVLLVMGAAVAIAVSPAAMWQRASLVTALMVLALGSTLMPLSWDRQLLASGIYKYSRGLPSDLDAGGLLRAGTLDYYRDGQLATISVKTFAGKRSLAVDGKVDGSSGGDMLTQELAAHIPLLLHEHPNNVLVVGLGTGVTVASAATHPVTQLDVVEISREVVEASQQFTEYNRHVLADPRVRLTVGDARSHMALSTRQYDVIISEPSNPWLAGVAALFTKEAFADMRSRLAPNGIACQWVHTYDMSEEDFRSIVRTFQYVFPEATLWTIGETDMLLVAAADGLGRRLGNLSQAWKRSTVRSDLARVGVSDPFAIVSLWAGGPRTLARLSAGAELQSDDRMALEFTAPVAAFSDVGANQAALVRSVLDPGDVPLPVQQLVARASSSEWVSRAAMFRRVRLFKSAFADYQRALVLAPLLSEALDGLATTAVPAGEVDYAMNHFSRSVAANPESVAVRLAHSKLLAAIGQQGAAVIAAATAANLTPGRGAALEQLAALLADANDLEGLQRVVPELEAMSPPSTAAAYYRATALFMQGDVQNAESLTTHAVALNGTDPDTWNLHGAVLASIGRREEALKAFLVALRLAPEDATVHANIGLLKLETGMVEDAREWFAAALALDPTSEVAREGLRQGAARSH